MSSDSTRGNWQKDGRLPLNISKHFFYCEGEWAQVAQVGYRVFMSGDTQKTPGHGPGQSALHGPAWARGLGQMNSKGAFQPQLFCGSAMSKGTLENLICNTRLARSRKENDTRTVNTREWLFLHCLYYLETDMLVGSVGEKKKHHGNTAVYVELVTSVCITSSRYFCFWFSFTSLCHIYLWEGCL